MIRTIVFFLLVASGCGGDTHDGPCPDGRDYCGTPSTMICCQQNWHCGGPADECCIPDCFPNSCDRLGNPLH